MSLFSFWSKLWLTRGKLICSVTWGDEFFRFFSSSLSFYATPIQTLVPVVFLFCFLFCLRHLLFVGVGWLLLFLGFCFHFLLKVAYLSGFWSGEAVSVFVFSWTLWDSTNRTQIKVCVSFVVERQNASHRLWVMCIELCVTSLLNKIYRLNSWNNQKEAYWICYCFSWFLGVSNYWEVQVWLFCLLAYLCCMSLILTTEDKSGSKSFNVWSSCSFQLVGANNELWSTYHPT